MVLPDEAVLASISSRACLKKRLYALRGCLGLLIAAPEALVVGEDGEEDIERGGDLDLVLDLLLGGECLLTTMPGLALVALSLCLVL